MLRRKLIWAGLATALVLGSAVACSPVQLLNSVTPSGGFEKSEDRAFADHARLKLDVYRPAEGPDTGPVVVFVHGGSWKDGSKDLYKFMGESLTSAGMTAVIPNYRLHPGILFPDPVVDTAKSIAWTVKNYPDRPIIVMGHSAGAYNVLMAAMDPQFLARENVEVCSAVAGVISLAGPVGIVPLKEEPYITIFPDRFTKLDAPLNQTDNPVPPMLLINGEKDKSVYPQNAQKLGEKLNARGARALVKIYPEMNHTDVVKHFSRFFDGDTTLEQDVFGFIADNQKIKPDYCY